MTNDKIITDVNELPLTLKVEDVMAVLRISRVVAYNLIHSQGFPKIQIGRRIIIPKNPFIEWINEKSLVA